MQKCRSDIRAISQTYRSDVTTLVRWFEYYIAVKNFTDRSALDRGRTPIGPRVGWMSARFNVSSGAASDRVLGPVESRPDSIRTASKRLHVTWMNNQCGAREGGWGSGEIEMRDKDAGLSRQFTAAATAAGTFVVCVDNRFSRLEPAISGVDSGASREHSMVIRGHSMVIRVFELRLLRRLLSLLWDYFSFNDSFDQNIEKQKQRASWLKWANQNIQILKMKIRIQKKTIHAWILGSTQSFDRPITFFH